MPWTERRRAFRPRGLRFADTPTPRHAPPDDLEQAAVEQVAYWFQHRGKYGLIRNRPFQGTYEQFAQLDLLPTVETVLKTYERWSL